MTDQHLTQLPLGLRGTTENDYDPAAFYCESQDHNGHSANMRVHIKPEIRAGIERLIATGKLAHTPVNSFSAFVRDALHHRLHQVEQMVDDPFFAHFIENARLAAVIQTRHAELLSDLQLIADAKLVLEAGMNANDVQNVQTQLLDYESMIPGSREPYAGQLTELTTKARSWLRDRDAEPLKLWDD